MSWTVIIGCLIIIAARVLDVSLGTLRTVMVVTGRRTIAFILGFFEVLIWITVVGQLVTNLNHWTYYPAYALGFAIGCFIGMTIEKRLALGKQVVQIFSRNSHAVATSLRAMSFGDAVPHLAVTEMEAKGHRGPLGVLYAEVPRKYCKAVTERVVQMDPEAYFVIDDVRHASSAASRAETRGPLAGLLARK